MQVLARLELCKQLHSNKSHLYFIWFLYDAVVSPSLQRMSPNSISWAHNNILCQSSTKTFGSGSWRSWNWLLKLSGSPLIPPVQDAFWLVIFLSSKTWSLHYSWVFSTFLTWSNNFLHGDASNSSSEFQREETWSIFLIQDTSYFCLWKILVDTTCLFNFDAWLILFHLHINFQGKLIPSWPIAGAKFLALCFPTSFLFFSQPHFLSFFQFFFPFSSVGTFYSIEPCSVFQFDGWYLSLGWKFFSHLPRWLSTWLVVFFQHITNTTMGHQIYSRLGLSGFSQQTWLVQGCFLYLQSYTLAHAFSNHHVTDSLLIQWWLTDKQLKKDFEGLLAAALACFPECRSLA